MKRSLMLACTLASALGPAAISTGAIAQTASTAPAASAATDTPNAPGSTSPVLAGPAKVGVIMFEQAVGATNEGRRDFSELQKKYEPKQAALKTQSDEIDALKKQSQSQSATLSDDQRATLAKTIDTKEKALQREAEDAQTAFQADGNDTYGKLAEKFYQVMVAYASQNGYTLVLDGSQSQQQAQQTVLWAPDSTNITLPVIQAYNLKSGVPAPPASQGATAPRTTTHPAARSTTTTTPKSSTTTTKPQQ